MSDRKRLRDVMSALELERLERAWNAATSLPLGGAHMDAKRGIRTLHKNRWFRSLLEARWAAMFDLLRWPYEYEPFELDGWIPDFILTGKHPVLVEVKPVVAFPVDVAEKIERSGTEHEVLIVGCTIPVPSYFSPHDVSPICFGWLLDREHLHDGNQGAPRWDDAHLRRWTDGDGRIGFCPDDGCYRDRITGSHCLPHGFPGRSTPTPSEVQQLWAAAGNNTQWRRKP